jgi:glycosyltransferase involved in cell wall biosynthesis
MPDSQSEVLIIAGEGSSSGLPVYVQDAMIALGEATNFVDSNRTRSAQLWARLRTLQPDRMAWFRAYEQELLFSARAWQDMSRLVLHRAGVAAPHRHLLQFGALHDLPTGRWGSRCIFTTYTMDLALADGTTPWRPSDSELAGYLDRERGLYQTADRLLVASELVKANLVSVYRVPDDRVHVVGMGVHDRYLHTSPNHAARTDPPLLLFVGKTFDLKGGQYFLAACDELAREGLAFQAIVAGPQQLDSPIPPGVRHVGTISPDEVQALYQQATLFVLPSLCDSFGFVFLESLASGVPCIGTNLNAMPEIITPDVGYIVPARDGPSIAAAIRRHLALSEEERQAMARRARQRVLDHYTWRAVASKVLTARRTLE